MCPVNCPNALGKSTFHLKRIHYIFYLIACSWEFDIPLQEYLHDGLANLINNNTHCSFSYTKPVTNASVVTIGG